MATNERQLKDLVSIGPAMLKDFELLGIRSVSQLAKQKPESLYEKLCRVTGKSQDICVFDTFSAAWRRRGIRTFPPSSASGGIGAASAKRNNCRLTIVD